MTAAVLYTDIYGTRDSATELKVTFTTVFAGDAKGAETQVTLKVYDGDDRPPVITKDYKLPSGQPLQISLEDKKSHISVTGTLIAEGAHVKVQLLNAVHSGFLRIQSSALVVAVNY